MSSPPQLYTMLPLSPSLYSPILPYAYRSSHIISPNASLPTSSSVSGGAAKIPRPPNAFMLFRSHFLKTRQIPLDEECRQQTISCVVGECWNMLPADEKAVWRRRAEEAKRAHMARYPGYKFSPSPRSTKASKKTKQRKSRDEAAAREKKERTRKLREEFTSFKGEAVPSQRKTKELARCVRGAERASRSRKVNVSASTSASYTAASTDPTNTSSPPSAAATTTSALFAPLPRLALHGAFVPSSTRLTPAPSTGPQITRIIQSPPLTPYHPNDRHPQLQLPEITLHDSSTAQWGFHQEREFGMGEISLSQGSVYPAMGASAYFEPRRPGMHVPVPVSDVDQSRSCSHSLNVGIGNMNVNININNYLDLHVDYPTFSMADGIDSFTGNYRDAPETPYDFSDALCFSPAETPSSPAWSCHPQTPSSYSSSHPPTPLTLAAPYPFPNHDRDREQLDLNNKELLTQRQAEILQAYEHKFGQGSLGLSLSGSADPSCFTDTAAAASYAANGAHDYGAWGQEVGADGLEIELGTMLYF